MWPTPQFTAIWSQLQKKSVMENFIFCAVKVLWRFDHFHEVMKLQSFEFSVSDVMSEIVQNVLHLVFFTYFY